MSQVDIENIAAHTEEEKPSVNISTRVTCNVTDGLFLSVNISTHVTHTVTDELNIHIAVGKFYRRHAGDVLPSETANGRRHLRR